MPLSREQFESGMNTQQYIDQIKVNKDPFVEIYNSVELPSDAAEWVNGLSNPVNLAVFTADWCGDAVSTTPVILRLADSTPNLNLQVFNRDDDVPLADTFLPEHRAGTVPIFVVLDDDLNEMARFIETANGLVPQIDAMDDTINRDTEGLEEAAQRQARRGRRMAHRVSHAQDWAEVIFARVPRRCGRRPATAPCRPPGGGRHQVAPGGLSTIGVSMQGAQRHKESTEP